MTLLEQELRAQPEAAASLLERGREQLPQLREALGGAEQVLMVARGSSDNAARYARYLWQLRLGLPVAMAAPSLVSVYGRPLDVRRQAVVAISQSGRSPDVVGVVSRSREAGRPTLAITNDPGSPLAAAAAHVLDLGVGPERSVAATKTYTASMLALALLSFAFDPDEPTAEALEELDRVPAALDAAIRDTSGVSEAAGLMARHDRAMAVGRGLHLGTAHEMALKLTELTGMLVAPYSPADLMHGPVAAVGADVPVVAIAPDEPATASVLEVVPELQRRGAPVVLVGPEDRTPPAGDLLRGDVPTAAAGRDWLTPVITVVAGQLLAWRTAELRGRDVDQPGDLSKVTLTE